MFFIVNEIVKSIKNKLQQLDHKKILIPLIFTINVILDILQPAY